MSPALEAFRENVTATLTAKGITRTQLADTLGMSRPALSRVLHGHEGISLERAEKIANYLGVPLSELIQVSGRARKIPARSA